MKIMDQWKYYMPLLDKKYPTETRMVALTCLMGMLSGDPATMPPMVFFDKCMRKLEILQGYKNNENDGYWSVEKFLNMIYGLCGETNNQQLMFGGLQLLMDLTAIPADPKPEAIEYIMEMTRDVPNMKEDIAESLLVIYQDPAVIIDFVHQNPPKPRQKGMLPNFMDIKRILIEHDCLKFAFNLMNSNSMQLKQLAMVLLIGLVGNYPDINEIKQRFGDTPDEKLQNGLRLVDALAGMGQEHLMRGDNQAAFGAFVEACKYLPKSAQLRYLTGILYINYM